MKLKRFLTIIALLILTMIMLTGCMEMETDAKGLLKFDDKKISITPDKYNYVYLEIDVKDGDLEDTFTKRFEVSKNKTLTIGLEDIAKDFFSENAQICNAKIVKTTKEIIGTMIIVIVLFIFIIIMLILQFFDSFRRTSYRVCIYY